MANKKINQLVSKTSILSTDIFGIGDATTGQLYKKTISELQAAIGGAVISVNGLVGTVVLNTDNIQEAGTPTNKYFTDARARGAISLTVTGASGASTYSSGTGILNVPTYTLAGLGGITAGFLSGTSGISYNSTTGVITYSGTVYTNASILALLSGGTGITYNSSTGAISYSGTVYTDASVRALISITTTGTSGASTYNNTTGVINVPNYTLAGLGGISLTSLSGGTGITYNSSTGAISYSGTVYTDASVRALISASGSVSYNATTGVVSLSGGNLTEATSSVLTITGGTGAVIGGGTSIQVKQATTSISGFLSSTDWTTFNSKQSTISLTTTGTSGAATFSANTLNIPNYGSALSGYLPLTGGTLTGGLIGTSATFSGNGNFGSQPLQSWGSIFKAIQVGTNCSIVSATSTSETDIALYSNTYYDGTNYKILNSTTQVPSYFMLGDGTLSLQIGNTGSVGSTVTGFTTKFVVTKTGSLLIAKDAIIGINTVDGSDSGYLALSGASEDGTTRGGHIYLSGNERSSDAGSVVIAGGTTSSGTGATASVLFRTSGAERMRITSDGVVGIGISNPAVIGTNYGSLVIAGSAGGGIRILSGTTIRTEIYADSGGVSFQAGTGLGFQFYTSGEKMRITSGGNILMGTSTDNGERLYVSGTIRATGTITANSDIRLKSNITKIENALEKVGQISGYTYNTSYDDKRHGGVIAQEIEKVFPEIVNTGNDGLMGVEYGNISALLIEAIKEQNIKIKNLETLLASK